MKPPSAGWISFLSSSISLTLAGLSIIAVLVRPRPRIRAWVLAGAFRKPLRHPKTWFSKSHRLLLLHGNRGFSWRVWNPAPKLTARLMEVIDKILDGENLLPVDVVSRVTADATLAPAGVDSLRFAEALGQLMRAAASPRSNGLVGRLLYPEETRQFRQIVRQLELHLANFGSAFAVVHGRETNEASEFSDFATALSGAPILVDSLAARSKYVDSVQVWHRRSYYPHKGHRETFASRHKDGRACKLEADSAEGISTSPENRMVGDFDRQVLNFEGVFLAESPTVGTTSFVLQTSETCYLATERPQDFGCKHLVPRAGDLPGMKLHKGVGEDNAVTVRRDVSPQSRVLLVTAYVSIITADHQLLLARRSGVVRHGQNVLSATAGGVLEPNGEGPIGDVDEHGMPSPLVGVLREAQEEIGIGLSAASVKPVVVFLANSRGLRPVNQRSELGLGQVVATVLYFARTPQTFAEVEKNRTTADLSKGAFELTALEPVLLGDEKSARPDIVAKFARAHAAQLDQHGLLSCLYAAALTSTVKEALAAFQREFHDLPWWAIPASTSLGTGADAQQVEVKPRVAFDPTMLMTQERQLKQLPGCEAWEDAWKQLAGWLAAAGDLT